MGFQTSLEWPIPPSAPSSALFPVKPSPHYFISTFISQAFDNPTPLIFLLSPLLISHAQSLGTQLTIAQAKRYFWLVSLGVQILVIRSFTSILWLIPRYLASFLPDGHELPLVKVKRTVVSILPKYLYLISLMGTVREPPQKYREQKYRSLA